MPFDHFDFLAPFYDNVIQPARVERIMKMAGLPAQGILLDAGGGTGRIAQTIRDDVDMLIVADSSVGMLSQAQQKGLTTACTFSEALPFADHSFERIIMVDALHHVLDQKKTSLELWRVLKQGGRLMIEEPDIRTFNVKLIALAEKLALMRSRFLSVKRITALFEGQGASIKVYAEDHNIWVVVEKEKNNSGEIK